MTPTRFHYQPHRIHSRRAISLRGAGHRPHRCNSRLTLSTATAADSDGTVSQVGFYQGATLIGTAAAPPYSVIWSNIAVGSYTLTAVPTDSAGSTKTSSAVTISVVPGPTVTLTSPAANQTYNAPAHFTLTASASPAPSSSGISRVDFYQGATLIGTGIAQGGGVSALAWNNIPVGTYVLTAVVTDTAFYRATSAPVSVTVNPPTSGVFYVYTDQLDTPRLVTDEQNNPMWRNLPTTEPFGVTPPEEDPNNTGTNFKLNLRFPGQYFDPETNLFYGGARYYDPLSGRFIQFDPIGLAGGINGYAYVKNNPLSYIDPTGLYCLSPYAIGAISGAAGGAVAGALAGGIAGSAAGGVGAVPGAIAGLFGGGALGAASGAIIAGSSAQGAYAGALGSGKTGSGIIGGAVSGIASYGFGQGGGLNPAAAGGLGGGLGGLFEAALGGAALGSGAAIGAIGGLVGGAVQQVLESGNDCGCGK